jgi:small subunit ribosomal protein S6e
MKFVISTKSGKAYSATSEKPLFLGKKIGESVNLDAIGLTGFEAKITGGSDKEGFPMEKSVQGSARKRILTAGGVGFKPKSKGERKRYSVRGILVSEEISQLNLVVTKTGSVDIDALLGKKDGAKEEGSAKDRLLGKK